MEFYLPYHSTMNSNERQSNWTEAFNWIKNYLKEKQIDTKKALHTLLATTLLTGGTVAVQKCVSSDTNDKKATKQEMVVSKSPEKTLDQNSLRKKPIDLGYEKKHPEQNIKFINFPKVSHTEMIQSKVSPNDKIIRCMRRKPITDAAEDKYWIPRGLLMAMMAQEGAWDPTLPNVKNRNSTDGKKYKITKSDWGLGLLHIQGANAEDFGLKVLQTDPKKPNAREMIDIQLGDKIIEAYYANKMDLKKLSEIDERWHPIEAIDCAARFLKSKYNPKKGKDAWIHALEWYSGRKWADEHSYPQRVLDYRVAIDHYLNKGKKSSIPSFTQGVNNYIKQTQKAWLGQKVEEIAKNIKVEIGGKKWWYDLYLKYHAQQCENYELGKYIAHKAK